VHDYTTKYPDKAVLFSADGFDHFGWAVFIAGGSLPVLPATTDAKFLADAGSMKPVELSGAPKDQWALGSKTNGYIVYNSTGTDIRLDLAANTNYKVQWLDPKTGQVLPGDQQVKGGNGVEIKPSKTGAAILWLTRM
jgi:hypothetical protein